MRGLLDKKAKKTKKKLKNAVISPERLEASVCKDSFFEFFRRFWSVIIPEPLVLNWHIEFLCNEIQKVAERIIARKAKEYDVVINVSPGSTKSTICSVMLPIWLWTRDATIRGIYASYAHPLSLHLASQSRNIVTSDKFRRLFPSVQLREEQKGLITNIAGGYRYATSTGGSVTGMHGHILVVDDPLNPKEAASDIQLKAANDWMDQTLLTRKVDRHITPLLLIMQRLHIVDPAGHMLDKQHTPGQVRHICLPAEETPSVRPSELRVNYQNGLFDPVRLSREALNSAMIDLGNYAYAGQFLQSPVPLEGGMFRTDKLMVDTNPPSLRRVVRYWDKAGTGGKGMWTVGCRMGFDALGRVWVTDVIRGQWEASQREQIIRQTAEKDGYGVLIGIEQEGGSGGKESAQGTVSRLAGFVVFIDRPVGDKALRADPFATQVNAGNVWLARASWNKAFVDEMQYFPNSRFKDQVDAASGAYAMLCGKRMRIGALR